MTTLIEKKTVAPFGNRRPVTRVQLGSECVRTFELPEQTSGSLEATFLKKSSLEKAVRFEAESLKILEHKQIAHFRPLIVAAIDGRCLAFIKSSERATNGHAGESV